MSRLKELRTPIFWVEGHPGPLDRENWKIEVVGLCSHSRVFSWQDLMSLPKTLADSRLTSVTRFSVFGRWGGIKVSNILDEVGMSSDVTHIRFWSVKNIYDTSIPVAIALKERTLLAYEFDGEWLEEDYGGPIRAFVPYLWGYKSAKSVLRIELMDRYLSGFWEKRGYTDDATIEAGFVRDINDGGRIRKIPEGEVLTFLDE
jgi:DMSO/TMAO reductase YedYZ molybdopterin-dependent catalytic subunit